MKIYENNLDDIFALVAILPDRLSSSIRTIGNFEDLVEIVMDIGRPPLARYTHEEIRLSDFEITEDDIEYVIKNVGDFDLDNRAGMERTLHRISAIRNRKREDCRAHLPGSGRAVFGTLEIIQDLSNRRSILILGKPGIGKNDDAARSRPGGGGKQTGSNR